MIIITDTIIVTISLTTTLSFQVGRVLLDKGADVNAAPVPSSRDTALTIAADKGHYRFVELLLSRGAQVCIFSFGLVYVLYSRYCDHR